MRLYFDGQKRQVKQGLTDRKRKRGKKEIERHFLSRKNISAISAMLIHFKWVPEKKET